MVFAQALSNTPKPVSPIWAQAEGEGGAPNSIPPADPNIGWRLVGTAVIDHGENLAIMEFKSTGGQGSVKEGDRLGDIRIKKILPDGIVIETGKGEVWLSVSAGRTESRPPPPHPPPQREKLPETGEVDSRDGDYGQILSEIRVRRQSDGDKISGVLIYFVKPDSSFSRSGLKAGDLIVAVNGRPLTTQQAIPWFYAVVNGGGPVSLKIDEGGNTKDLSLVIH